MHGYTSHGHSCCDQAPEPLPILVARCGGPGICAVCATEKNRLFHLPTGPATTTLMIVDDPNPPVTIANRTRITLPEVPGVVFVQAGLHTRDNEAEVHLVEENEWRRRRVARGLPVDHLATPGAAAAE